MLNETSAKSLPWEGAITAAWVGMIGCTLLAIVILEPWSGGFHFSVEGSIIAFANLLALPFLAAGGYALGWFYQKTQWHLRSKKKAILAGAAAGTITIIVVFVAAALIQTCLPHNACISALKLFLQDPVGSIREFAHYVFPDWYLKMLWVSFLRFLMALPIAALCGGITGWRLTRVSEQA